MPRISSSARKYRRLFSPAPIIIVLLVCVAINGGRRSSAGGAGTALREGRTTSHTDPQTGVQGGRKFPGLWLDKAEADIPAGTNVVRKPRTYRVLELNRAEMTQALAQAPLEFSEDDARRQTVITLPAPDGVGQRFSIRESPVISPELAAQFPEIKTYSGQGIDDPTANMRLSMTPRGLNAFVIGEQGSFMVTPYAETDAVNYLSYFTRDVEGASFECHVPGAAGDAASAPSAPGGYDFPKADPLTIANGTLREYRLSFTVTQQFYQHFGGPTISPANDTGVVAALAAYVSSVNAIYEREIAIRFKFNSWIADRPGICSQSFNCFPTDQNVGQMLEPNQFILDTVYPGAANYDIGAAVGYSFAPLPGGVSSFGSGGASGVGGACENTFKGRSATQLVGTAGDYIGTVILAHEWGHMFGARHTFSSLFCNPSQLEIVPNRVEPGSGSTIMSYAPVCPPENLFTGNPSSGPDNYFHVHSLLKIVNHKTVYPSCGQSITTGNAPPTLTSAGATANIPNLTPFTLTAAASDPNGDALTYSWEEWDPGATLFRSYRPSTSPSRTFPSLAYILNNGNVPPVRIDSTSVSGEVLPAGSGSLFFTVTVRDNRSGGGGVTARDTLLQINVVGTAGPFRVTFPNAQTTLPSGPVAITWNVAGTNLAPIGTSSVRILLSTDGGSTFPTVLSAGTPNDGSETVTLPAVQVTTARIKVEAVGNIYFDISDTNFTISSVRPNLTPFQPTGWSDKIVVSNVAGTTTDASPLRANDTLYLDWAVLNNGTTATGTTFFTRLYIDGTERAFWFSDPPLNPNFFTFVTDYNLGSLSAGTHTIRIVADTPGGVAESNEADNEYTRTITVQAQSTVQLSSPAYTAGETVGLAAITVTRGGTLGSATVNYATSDAAGANNCATLSGAASSRCDYITTVGTLNFAPNETSKTVLIPLVNDSYVEGPESLTVSLSGPSGVSLGPTGSATLTIVDNETVAGVNPISQPGFFVGEHYFDFLNREPDTSGFNFWVGEITSCGSNAQCVEVKRINVSAAFFLSIEFQNTGYLVYRTYKAAYGDATSPNVPGTVPVINLSEFLPDTQRIGRDVVVGQGAWQAQLEANKQAYMVEFVQRQRFLDAYPPSLTPAQFVDQLRLNTGTALSQAERDQLVAQLTANNTNAGRAAVLRSVAEDADLQRNEFNRAFVLMQYFGYLRRDPDAAPDADFRGWKFWLDKLNQFNGDFAGAEMVKAFITSAEYRARFGAN